MNSYIKKGHDYYYTLCDVLFLVHDILQVSYVVLALIYLLFV